MFQRVRRQGQILLSFRQVHRRELLQLRWYHRGCMLRHVHRLHPSPSRRLRWFSALVPSLLVDPHRFRCSLACLGEFEGCPFEEEYREFEGWRDQGSHDV